MARYQILYWYDIPTQVRAIDDNGRAKARLSPRFLEAVNKAAMVARITGDDAYRLGFHWSDAEELDGTAKHVAQRVASDLEQQFADIPWRETAQRLKNEKPPDI